MSRVFAGFVIGLLLIAPALKAEERVRPDDELRDNWLTSCEKDSCFLHHAIPSGGAAAKKQDVYVTLEFDKASGEPGALIVVVPADADPKAGVHVEFADLPARGSDEKPGQRREPVSFTLQIYNCDSKVCLAGTRNKPGTRDIQTYFIENFGTYSFFGISYQVKGETPVFMELTKAFTRGYETLQAELKKPQ